MPKQLVQPAGLQVEIAGSTDRGLVRDSSEDSLLILQGEAIPNWCSAIIGVFDGVGRLGNGQEASSRATIYLAESLADSMRPQSESDPGQVVAELMRNLHLRLRTDRKERPDLGDMATSGTVAPLPRTEPPTLWIGHVGDSPAFRLSAGTAEKLLQEDSLVADLLRDGLILPKQARQHPQRHVIPQALGHNEEIKVHVGEHQVSPGDCYLICTDGLTSFVPETRLPIIVAAKSPTDACQDLIAAANAAGGLDNITVGVTRF